MRVNADITELERVTAYVTQTLEAHDCPPKAGIQLSVAVEEIFVNIAHYAYGAQKGEAEVTCRVEDGVAVVRFVDSGVPFDPLKRPDPDVTKPAEARETGGLGIYMVKKSMDRVTYAYENGCNVLTLYKKL